MLGVVKIWHKVTKGIKLMAKALTWVATIDFSLQILTTFEAVLDLLLSVKLKTIPLLAHQVRTVVLPFNILLQVFK
ncbi:hypothetical protein JG687_00018252 [Phytophthora cactorum]|uniref:Uncharacterized protein n=1 Tax=Phytophthora cactorum TaxID=29920 RepID=A0A8T1TQA5_9STRA|nr:hypothetical protein JG687_00018252 [Phytophthora cactorum]